MTKFEWEIFKQKCIAYPLIAVAFVCVYIRQSRLWKRCVVYNQQRKLRKLK